MNPLSLRFKTPLCGSFRPPTSLFAITMGVALSMSQAYALTWSSAGPTDVWSIATGNENWLPGPVVWSQNSDALFDNSAETVTAATGTNFNNVTFGVTGFTVAGTVDIDSTDNASSVTVTNSGDGATISAIIRNNGGGATAGALVKNGAGSLTLTGLSTFTGGTTVDAGILNLGTIGQTISPAGTGIIRGTLNIAAGATVNANAKDSFGYTNGLSVSSVTVSGTLVNNAANISQGAVGTTAATSFILNGGTMASNSTQTSNNTGWQLNTQAGASISSLANAVTSTIAGRVNMRGTSANTSALVINVADGAATTDLSITANITSGSNGSGIVTKTGSGFLALSGTNTYVNGTNINAGTVSAGSASALGTGTVSIGGGTLDSTVANVNTGSIAVNSGGLAINGASIGTYTLNATSNFSTTSGVTLSFTLNNAGGADRIISATGGAGTEAFTLANGTIIALGATDSINYASNYTLFQGFDAGTVGTLNFTGLNPGYTASISNAGILSFSPVPEPSMLLLSGVGALGLIRRRRQA